jgi:Putative prokaryotic signal transducing protein
MAQDPALDVDPSPELDMVTVFSSSNHDAEMEATSLQTMLQANGIDAIVQGSTMIPSLEFQVQVAREDVDEAARIISEARAAGPEAAAEAEAASEQQ